MNTIRDTYDVLFSLSWRLRRVNGNLRYSRDTIRSDGFEIDLWNHQFQSDFIPMYRLLERYMNMPLANREVITDLDMFMYFWHHLIDAVARETSEWRVRNIELVKERIVHAQWSDDLIREEMQRLSENMPPFRNTNAYKRQMQISDEKHTKYQSRENRPYKQIEIKLIVREK